MRKTERQRLILQRVQQAAPAALLSTSDLARHFAVSETTIRRDFQDLAGAGLIQRQYGGAHSRQPAQSVKTGPVGILLVSRIDKYRDPFYNIVLEGAESALEAGGYQVAFVKTLHEISTLEQAKRLLSDFNLRGLILLGYAEAASIRYLRENLSPIVTVADNLDLDDELVLFDGERGMRLLIAHLARLGHRRLAYISGYADLRYSGFCSALAENNLPHVPALHQILAPGPSGWTPDLGERGARLLRQSGAPIDAIVCASDRLAIGAMAWLQRHGCQVPGDIAVTGFDDIPDSQFTFPRLTTVHVHKTRLGQLAAQRLIQRIENPSDIPLKIITPASLVVRQSCGAPHKRRL